MKKNSVILYTLGISAALHGFILFGAARNGFRVSPAVSQNSFASAIKVIKTGIATQENMTDKAQEKRTAEKPVNPIPESFPSQKTEIGNEDREGADAAGETGTITAGEYDQLLAYIKDFIGKNLIYPPMARQRNIEGIVGVYFEIENNGEIISVRVSHSSGSSILDNAAVSLVKKLQPLKKLAITKKLDLNVNIDYKLTE
jgi:TonB family protein